MSSAGGVVFRVAGYRLPSLPVTWEGRCRLVDTSARTLLTQSFEHPICSAISRPLFSGHACHASTIACRLSVSFRPARFDAVAELLKQFNAQGARTDQLPDGAVQKSQAGNGAAPVGPSVSGTTV